MGRAILLRRARDRPFGFVAAVDHDRPAPGASARFDVVENVADHPRTTKVDPGLPRGPLQQSGVRLAAQALDGKTLDTALRVVWTAIEPRERCAVTPEQRLQSLADGVEVANRETAECRTRLVADDDERQAERPQQSERFPRTRDEVHARGIDVVGFVN